MSAPAVPAAWDLASASRVPMTRLVGVELRKGFDTRSGRWLAITMVGLCVVVMLLTAFAFSEDSEDFRTMTSYIGGTLGTFLPIVIILLVTSEWSQRTGLVTFALEPRRGRVVSAKVLASLIVALVVLALAMLIAASGTALGTLDGGDAVWNVGVNEIQSFVLASLIGVLLGLALGMLLINSPAAIVAFFVYSFVLPTVVGVVGFYIEWIERNAAWFEFNTAQLPLFTGDYRPNGEEWAQLATTGVIWLVIPFGIGVRRLLRAEVK